MMLDAVSSDLAAAVGVDVTATAVITAANVANDARYLPPTSTAAPLPLLLTMMQMTGGAVNTLVQVDVVSVISNTAKIISACVF